MDPSGENICPSCKKPLPQDAPLGELCPQCLMKAGLYSGTAPESEVNAERRRFAVPGLEELQPHFPQLEILELIGRGGMGAVYKARQPALNRLVALKILARDGDGEEDARFAERFQREARALAQMNHPNIVTVYDFGEQGGHYYLLMEYVDGLNLRQIEQGRKLSPAEALAIVPPICDALQYAHGRGVVHRDIKPENILLDKDGRVKIADFGIAKILGADGGEALTGDDHRVGTPFYMAPEQVERPGEVDHRADIYSLGVVFYEMLTGELPMGRFAPPSKKVQVDVRLDEIVLRALEKEPELRFQQASEIRTGVEMVTGDAEGGVAAGVSGAPGAGNGDPAGGDGTSGLLVAEAEKRGQLQSLVIGGVTMLLMLVFGSRITDNPQVLLWWYAGFGIGLLTIGVRFLVLKRTPAGELAAVKNIEKPLPDATAVERVRTLVRPAGMLLIISGLFTLLLQASMGFAGTVYFRANGWGGASGNPVYGFMMFLPMVVKFLAAILVVLGGSRMLAMRSHGLCVAAAIMGIFIVPFYMGIPIGIWALVVLDKAEVRNAFVDGSAGRAESDTRLGLIAMIAMILGMLAVYWFVITGFHSAVAAGIGIMLLNIALWFGTGAMKTQLMSSRQWRTVAQSASFVAALLILPLFSRYVRIGNVTEEQLMITLVLVVILAVMFVVLGIVIGGGTGRGGKQD